MNDRGAVYMMSAAAHSLGHDVSEFNINRSSIRRHQQKHRMDGVALKEELRGGLHSDCSLGREIDAGSYNQGEHRSTSHSGFGQ